MREMRLASNAISLHVPAFVKLRVPAIGLECGLVSRCLGKSRFKSCGRLYVGYSCRGLPVEKNSFDGSLDWTYEGPMLFLSGSF